MMQLDVARILCLCVITLAILPTIYAAAKDVCLLRKKVGPCRAAIPRYYYDARSATCRSFIWGGCRSNGNNFRTMSECKKTCTTSTPVTPQRSCDLPVDRGMCLAYMPRWYYSYGTCKRFIYGGCGGNANNFMTEAECQRKCLDYLG